ncbi:hypothetical protein ACVW0J_006180 [Bradyrhizobium sp. i1.7.7]
MRTSSTSPGWASFTATGPVQMCTPNPSPAPRPNTLASIGPAPRRSTFFLSRVQPNTLSAPESPAIIISGASEACCVSVSMVMVSPEAISICGDSERLK